MSAEKNVITSNQGLKAFSNGTAMSTRFFFIRTSRSPLLGVCILRTTAYWGCESTVLRGSSESRGIQCIQCAL